MRAVIGGGLRPMKASARMTEAPIHHMMPTAQMSLRRAGARRTAGRVSKLGRLRRRVRGRALELAEGQVAAAQAVRPALAGGALRGAVAGGAVRQRRTP